MNKNGFTLIELAVTLVIVGLLIGGLLVAQSIISAAKMTKAVSQLEQFDTALRIFTQKYKYLPGDYSGFENGGNEDGIVDDNYTHTNPTTFYFPRTFYRENTKFWPSLQLNGMKIEGIGSQLSFPSLTTYVNPESSGPSQNIPSFKLGEKTGVFPFSHTRDRGAGWQITIGSQTIGSTVRAGLFYFLADFDTSNSSSIYNASGYDEDIPVMQAYNLDLKIDDGAPNTGDVINFSYTASGLQPGCVFANWSTSYEIDEEDGLCALIVRADYE